MSSRSSHNHYLWPKIASAQGWLWRDRRYPAGWIDGQSQQILQLRRCCFRSIFLPSFLLKTPAWIKESFRLWATKLNCWVIYGKLLHLSSTCIRIPTLISWWFMTTSFRRRLCPSQVRGLVDAEGVGVPHVWTGWKNMTVEINTVPATVLYFDRRRVRLWEFQISVVWNFHYIISIFNAWFLRITCNLSIWSEINWLGAPSQPSRTGTLKSLKSCWNMLEVHSSLLIQWTGSGDDGAESRFWTSGTVAKHRSSITWPLKGYFLHLVPGKPSPIGKPWRCFCWDWVPSLHVSVLRFSWLHFGPSISFSNGTGVLEDKHQI